jgi:hypothetical protein
MKAIKLLNAFEDNLPHEEKEVKIQLNYGLHNLKLGKPYYEFIDDLQSEISYLPEAPEYDYDEGSASFTLRGSQQAVDSGVEVILKALKPIPYVKAWKDDVVVLDNFGKEYADVENEDGPAAPAAPAVVGPVSAPPAGNASSADIAGRNTGPTQPGAVMGGNVNNLGPRPLTIFGVVRYSYRKEKEPKPKKKRKKMIPRPKSLIGESNKAKAVLNILSEVIKPEEPKEVEHDHAGGKMKITYHPNGYQMDVHFNGHAIGRFDADHNKDDVRRAKGFVDMMLKHKKVKK